MIMQGVTGSKGEGSGNIFTFGLTEEVKWWTEFCNYVKRRKGSTEGIPAIKDHNGKLITNPIEKAYSLNSYYASLFSCERNIPQIQSTESG